MSHSVVLVLVRPEVKYHTLTKSARSAIIKLAEKALVPFDENLSVPEYETDCWCVGRVARSAALEAAEKKYPMDAIRKAFHDAHPLPVGCGSEWDLSAEQEEEREKIWREQFLKEREEYEETLLKAHPLYQKPDPKHRKSPDDDDACNGTGKVKSTYNPKSRWDWYAIGGRWQGYLCHSEEENQRAVRDAKYDVQYVKDLLPHWQDRHTPFALLTPDGEWHERGKMGWFGMSDNKVSIKDWRQQVRTKLGDHSDCAVVVVDVHI